jgi:mannose-6-phosphate isomerase-like protein (cupin superfamily)
VSSGSVRPFTEIARTGAAGSCGARGERQLARMLTRKTTFLAATALVLTAAGAGFAQPGQTAPVPFRGDIEKLTENNSDFRRVLFTGAHIQIVAMSLAPNEDIGAEVHTVDQCFFFEKGEGQAVLGDKLSPVKEDDVLCVPAGMRHNIRNTGKKALKLFTTYSPPQHPAGTIHHTKQEAEQAEKSEAKAPR